MVGWHHQLNGHEFEQTLGDSEGQGSLVCCSPWGCKELDTTERLNNALFPPAVLLFISRSIISLPSQEALAAPPLPPEAHLFQEVSPIALGSWEKFSASCPKNVFSVPRSRKWKHRKMKIHAVGHKAQTWQTWQSNPHLMLKQVLKQKVSFPESLLYSRHFVDIAFFLNYIFT